MKVFAGSGDSVVKGAVTASGDPAGIDESVTSGPVSNASATVNARVAAEPAELDAMVIKLVGEISARYGATADLAPVASFKPGYPTPVHKLAVGDLASQAN